MSERLLKKKLLTLSGAVGILVCGACLLPPPLPPHPPPRPPVPIGLEGIRSIRVEVANTSPLHHLDPAALAQRIADTINKQSSRMNVKLNAHFGKKAGDGDAVLEFTVLSETLETVTPAKVGSITFRIEDSATLTRLDGALVWRETEAGSSIVHNVAEGDPSDVWKEPGLVEALSKRLVLHMLYGR